MLGILWMVVFFEKIFSLKNFFFSDDSNTGSLEES